MNVSELIEYLSKLDGEMIVEIEDSTYPIQELEERNIHIRDGRVSFY